MKKRTWIIIIVVVIFVLLSFVSSMSTDVQDTFYLEKYLQKGHN